MKQILFLLMVWQSTLFATPVDGVLDWVEQGYKNFRTYPRVNRAYILIEDNKTKEAKVLLKKALEIDNHNQKAIDMMLNLCLEERDDICINRYINRAKSTNMGYIYQQKAQNAKENQEYNRAITLANRALKYKLKREDKYFVNLIIFDSYLKLKLYKKADDFINKDNLITYQLLKWSRVSDNLGESQYAYKLASELPNKVEYLKWQIELLLKEKRYKEASNKMELLYQREPTTDNKKQLIHLYSLTKQDENIVKIYQQKLDKQCDEYALTFLLDYYKDNKKEQNRLLEKEYPYSCLPKEKRVKLSLELINRLQKKNPKKAKRISKNIMKDVEETASDKKLLAFYQASGQKNKMVKMYEKKMVRGCDRYSLLYLLDFYKNSVTKYNELLQKSYPYSCLPQSTRVSLSLELVNLLADRNPAQSKKILDRLDMEEIEPSAYMNISNLEAKLGDYQKSISYALAYLKQNPNDIVATKNIGYSYFKIGEKELSVHYLLKASKLDSNDVDLLKNIGYLCVELKQFNTAVYYWNLYLNHKSDAKIRLELVSLYYYKLKDYTKAEQALKAYEQSTKLYTAQYYLLKAKLAYRHRDCDMALNSYDNALKVKSDENSNYEYVHLLKQCNQEHKALQLMQKLSLSHSNNLQYKKELAYMYEKNKNYPKAIEQFQYLSKQEPMKSDNHLSLAYAYKKMGENEQAVVEFKKAIDSSPNMDDKKLHNIKNEIKNSSKRFSAYIAQSARLDGDKRGQSPTNINNATYNGFGAVELDYQPKILPKRTTLFANVLHNHKNIEKSAQPSVGVRYQPLKDKQFFISAQKLIKGGESSREDALIRASLGISSDKNTPSSIYQNLYLDSGYFTKANTLIAYGNYEVGKIYNINKNLKISPYLTTGGTLSNDNAQKKEMTNLDIGAGVAMDITPDESRYEPALYRNRLKLEARQKYAGNSNDKNTVHLQWEFFY